MIAEFQRWWFMLRLYGYLVTPMTISVRQAEGVVVVPRAQIEAVKERSVSHVIVRLRGGRRLVLNLFGLGSRGCVAVSGALRESCTANLKQKSSTPGRPHV